MIGRMDEFDTLVCAGIDPNPERIPKGVQVRAFLQTYMETVAPYVCAFKAQKAYFDALDDGWSILRHVAAHARELGVPLIVDGKLGDIDETMKAYTKRLFDDIGADGILVNPYMGDDVFRSLEGYAEKAIVVLVKSSNPGGSSVQDILTHAGRALWQEVLHLTVERWNGSKNLIPVIASTHDVDLAAVRRVIPDGMPLFLAGVGAQGGSLDAVKPLLDSHGRGVMVNSARGLMYPKATAGQDWKAAIEAAVVALRDALNAQRR